MVPDTVIPTVHILVGALWVGSVAFVAGVTVPAVTDGSLDAAPVETIADRLVSLPRSASVVMLLTGGYLAVSGHAVASLTGAARGHIVLGTLALWLVLTALTEIGRDRLVDAGLLSSGIVSY